MLVHARKNREVFTVFLLLLLASVPLVYAASIVDLERTVIGQTTAGDWRYRRSITIHNSSGAGTNYQKRFTIFYNGRTQAALDFYGMSEPWTTISGDPNDTHAFLPVLRTRIVACNKDIDGGTQKYLAYDSNYGGLATNLYYANDTDGQWTPYSGNPILSERWAMTGR